MILSRNKLKKIKKTKNQSRRNVKKRKNQRKRKKVTFRKRGTTNLRKKTLKKRPKQRKYKMKGGVEVGKMKNIPDLERKLKETQSKIDVALKQQKMLEKLQVSRF